MDGFAADALIADKGYDSREVLEAAEARRMEVVIPRGRTGKISGNTTVTFTSSVI
jgi:hypothetical protein